MKWSSKYILFQSRKCIWKSRLWNGGHFVSECNHWLMSSLQGRFNSLAPGKFEWNFRYVIFKQILVIDGWGISSEIALIWMSLDFTDDKSILVQVMGWCRKATSHYLNQCWPRSLPPYGVSRPQWTLKLGHGWVIISHCLCGCNWSSMP